MEDTTSQGEKPVDQISEKLRFDFVDLVFALAIGQVGIELGDFFVKNETPFYNNLYVFSHLALCTYIISTSWVGWNLSRPPAKHGGLKSVFSKEFVLLIIDLLIVFLYFIMVRSVEKPWECAEKDCRVGFNGAECHSEIIWSIGIFFLYFAWQVISDWFKDDSLGLRGLHDELNKSSKMWYQAIICIIFCFAFWHFFGKATESKIIISTDIGLLFIFMLFRGMIAIRYTDEIKPKHWAMYIAIPLLSIIITFVYNIVYLHL